MRFAHVALGQKGPEISILEDSAGLPDLHGNGRQFGGRTKSQPAPVAMHSSTALEFSLRAGTGRRIFNAHSPLASAFTPPSQALAPPLFGKEWDALGLNRMS